jgi:hypothetical protein
MAADRADAVQGWSQFCKCAWRRASPAGARAVSFNICVWHWSSAYAPQPAMRSPYKAREPVPMLNGRCRLRGLLHTANWRKVGDASNSQDKILVKLLKSLALPRGLEPLFSP